MNNNTIKLGYELESGEEVRIPLHHLLITGVTQLSGKTTTLEALIQRGEVRAIAFRTKRGELGFDSAHHHQPFFRQRADWMYVQALLAATMRQRMKFEESWIMKVCEDAGTLPQVQENVKQELETARGLSEGVYTRLDKYLDIVVPQIESLQFTDQLVLLEGLNVMDLEAMTAEMQSLVIQSVMDHTMDHFDNVVVVVPEAWQFIPQRRGNPVKWAAERFIRQGAVLGNYLWLDSQDIAGVDKSILKSIDIWILGRQREHNEVQRTLKQVPVPRGEKPPPEAIMRLPVGHFYAAFEDVVKKIYVQPTWLDDKTARSVALGAPIPGPPKFRDDGDEAMWKQKYEELKAESEKRVETFKRSLLAKEQMIQERDQTVEGLHAELAELVPIQEFLFYLVKAIGGTSTFTVDPGTLDVKEAVREALEELTKEGEVAHLIVENEIPELVVEHKVIHLNATTEDYRGKLGLLIAEGHFDVPTKASPVLKEMEARGWGKARGGPLPPNFYREIKWFTESGFLRYLPKKGREGDEWVVVPEAKERLKVEEVEDA